MGVRQHRVDHSFVRAGLAQPLRREVGVALGVVRGLILVQVVEQPGLSPQLLVLAEAPCQRPHHTLHRDEMPDGRLLLRLLRGELPRFR